MKRKSGILRKLIASSVLIFGISAPGVPASAMVTLPPKGVSQELWTAFQEVAISNLSGVERNLRWTASPSFYITGEPTFEDNSTFRQTIAEIAKYCNTIKPFSTAAEPAEGAFFHYLAPENFKTIIPEIPSDVTTSYGWTTYRTGGGATKFSAVLSTRMSQTERNQVTQIRILQGMGMRGYTKNLDAKMFSWAYPFVSAQSASELDKQIIRLYCSTYIESGDTAQETFDAITRAWSKPLTSPAIDLNIKAVGYKEQINYSFNFDPSKALDLQMSGIEYRILGPTGATIKTGILDVSTNLFKSHTVVLSSLKDKSTYTLEAFPVNAKGKGFISKSEGKAGSQPAPQDSSGSSVGDESVELLDAKNAAFDSTDAAKEAFAAIDRTKSDCVAVSSDFGSIEQELFNSTNLISGCSTLDDKVSALKVKILSLDPNKATTVDQANVITTNANLYAENSDALVAQLQDITDELSATEKAFTMLSNLLDPVNQLESVVAGPWETLNERLSILPLSLQSKIKKSTNYKSAKDFVFQAQKLIASRDLQLELLSNLSDSSKLSAIVGTVGKLKVSSAQIENFRKLLSSINKSIPPFVCQKGSLTVLSSKSGKCAKGFDSIPTS